MAGFDLKQEVQQLDALSETATLRDLLVALEHHAATTDAAHEPELAQCGSGDDPRSALGLTDACAARRRRAAGHE